MERWVPRMDPREGVTFKEGWVSTVSGHKRGSDIMEG